MAHRVTLIIRGSAIGPMPLRQAMREVFIRCGSPQKFRACMSEKWKVWIVVDSERFMSIIEACQRSPQPDHSRNFLDDRYFLSDADVVRTSGNAYVLSTQWAASATGKTLNEVIPCLERVFAPEGLKIRIA